MKKVLAFGASSSKNSINKKFATWAAGQITDAEVTVLDLNDYEMPIFSVDIEAEEGIPAQAHAFKEAIRTSDAIVMSFAEHNGAYSAAFKNIYDWVSRIEKDMWCEKPLFLLATSTGGRGGQDVLATAVARFSHGYTATIVDFSLPSFDANFSEEQGITDTVLRGKFEKKLEAFRL